MILRARFQTVLLVFAIVVCSNPECACIVESVTPWGSGSAAGILPGDLLLGWSDEEGTEETTRSEHELENIQDWDYMLIEHLPKHKVFLKGERDGNPVAWELEHDFTGMSVIPALDNALKELYREAVEASTDGRSEEEVKNLWNAIISAAEENNDIPLQCFLLVKAYRETKGKVNIALSRQFAENAYNLAMKQNNPVIFYQPAVIFADHLFRTEGIEKSLEVLSALETEINRKYGGSLFLAKAVRDTGDYLQMAALLEESKERYSAALTMDEALSPGSYNLSRSLFQNGYVTYILGDIRKALEYYERSFDISGEIAPVSMNTGYLLNNMGLIAQNAGDIETAGQRYMQAYEVYNTLAPDGLAAANSLGNLGNLETFRGNYDKAREYFNRALELSQKSSPQSINTVNALLNLGVFESELGNLYLARELYQKAYGICAAVSPESVEMTACLNNLGLIEHDLGNLVKAEENYRKALEITRSFAPENYNVIVFLVNIGNIHNDRCDFTKAEDYLLEALSMAEKTNPVSLEIAAILGNLGDNALNREDYELAEEYHLKSLEMWNKIKTGGTERAICYNNLGNLALTTGDLINAEEYLKKALSVFSSSTEGNAKLIELRKSIALLYLEKNDLKTAAEEIDKAIRLTMELLPGSMDEAECRHVEGKIFLASGNIEHAGASFKKAVEVLESQKSRLGGGRETSERFMAHYADYYRDLIGIEVHNNEEVSAFETLEKFRAKSLLEMIAERKLDLRKDAPPGLVEEKIRLNILYERVQSELAELDPADDPEYYAELGAQRNSIRAEQLKLIEEMRKASPALASLEYPEALGFKEVKEVIPEDTLFLSYCVADKELYIFRVFRGELDCVTVPAGRDSVSRKAALLVNAVSHPGSDYRAVSGELYNLLIKPVEEELGKAGRLLVCPDGPLNYLPFAALLDGRGEYLAEKTPLAFTISATVYSETTGVRNAGDLPVRVAAFGDPVYRGAQDIGENPSRDVARRDSLAPLPATRQEVDAICGLFKDNCTKYLGGSATEESVNELTKDYSIVHFACHGILDPIFPLDSSLVLSEPENETDSEFNGFLQAWEILERVRLDTDLVVLSACGTGLGEEMGGEGIIGLNRAFLYAGARSILSTHWSVADRSTAELMKKFYTNLKRKNAPVDALRKAQKAMIKSKKYSHPFYWAAFHLNTGRD